MLHIPECATSDEVVVALKEAGCAYLASPDISHPSHMANVMKEIFGEHSLLPYESDRISPRTRLDDCVYTSTDFSAIADIYFHNECSAAHEWPRYIAFYCRKAAAEGGNTTVSSIREVTAALRGPITAESEKLGVAYLRNLGGDIGNSIAYTFGTTDRNAIERQCTVSDMTPTWREDGSLQLRFKRQSLVKHPTTGESLWFNNIAFWHPKSLDRTLRLGLRGRPETELAFSSRFGDDSPIPPDWIDAMLDAYNQAQVPFRWREGGMLILDNMLFAHGREKFRGEREVWVAMSQKVSRREVENSAS